MNALNLISSFSRLSIIKNALPVRNISTSQTVYFRATQCLMAEPLKKKKRLDPAIIKAREERKRKKIEKQIRRLEKSARQLKPIDECEVPLEILDTRKSRERSLPPLSSEIVEKRASLEKAWARYKQELHLADVKMLDRIIYSQQRALDELRKDSEELYQEAIQIEFQLLPITINGPVETPPIENYEFVDGEYQDVSKKWD